MNTEDTKTGVQQQPSSMDGVYLTISSGSDDEISFFDLWSAFWELRWFMAIVIFLCAIASIGYLLIADPVYRAEALLAPNSPADAPSVGAEIGGLAQLAGINIGSSPSSVEAIAMLRSREFAREFIRDRNLLPILFADEWDESAGRWISRDEEDQPDLRSGVEFFVEDVRSVNEDAATGLVTLSVEWTDPELAAAWVNDLVARINTRLRERDLARSERRLEYLREALAQANLVELQRAIGQLIENETQTIMLAKADEEYAFRLIDPPEVPREPSAPSKLAVAVVSGLFCIFAVFLSVLIRSVVIKHREQRAHLA